jgi:hypothetical protein
MPLTDFQERLARLLSSNRTEDSYLAGGAALHLQPSSKRYSNDLDYFHDSEERVATAFSDDRALLQEHHYAVDVDINQPGYIRATVKKQRPRAWNGRTTRLGAPAGFWPRPCRIVDACLTNSAGLWLNKHFYL